ncbi:DTW domain-containing protein [Vibrio sp. JC009]|uniref:tRNA-uridine aminocarboxypropyltransferase n=1 Tax=Vibrio sp. JC009 TaxID=2912314 RepID=UPI0023AEFB9A|nr:tRNA-uridine aminocarboxypropyltransferase [Vibrio sp. JC009]WED22601.1 DTW domain-containing protein [Vibrio sp. JC009]
MSRYCQQCGKAKKACICSWIESIDNRIELIILQHPTEINQAKGTAKILSLSLKHNHCYVGEDFSGHRELNQLLNEEGVQPLLVYPGENAEPAEQFALKFKDSSPKIRLVIIDGTWRKAYKIYQLSSNLQALPAVTISAGIKGNYRIRKAPSDESLSTVEAGFYALSALDEQTDYSPLMHAFEKMIDFQIAQMPEGVYERNYSNTNTSN